MRSGEVLVYPARNRSWRTASSSRSGRSARELGGTRKCLRCKAFKPCSSSGPSTSCSTSARISTRYSGVRLEDAGVVGGMVDLAQRQAVTDCRDARFVSVLDDVCGVEEHAVSEFADAAPGVVGAHHHATEDRLMQPPPGFAIEVLTHHLLDGGPGSGQMLPTISSYDELLGGGLLSLDPPNGIGPRGRGVTGRVASDLERWFLSKDPRSWIEVHPPDAVTVLLANG